MKPVTKRQRVSDLPLSEPPLNLYGSLEPMIRAIRDHRPLDLCFETWRDNPAGAFVDWQAVARRCVLDGLHHDPGPLDLRAETLSRERRDGFMLERVAFNTAPWTRVNGYFLLPEAELPVPGLVVFHAWGGPMLFGRDRVVDSGRRHPLLTEHRDGYYSGQCLAEVFARAGYAVIVIDAHHFGERVPKGLNGIPAEIDPYTLDGEEYARIDTLVRDQLYLGVRQLMWAGTTWMGVNFHDDSRCVDYLVSRPEVDHTRIGCTGLSGGGWRTNMLAALDHRVSASVSVGWMTVADWQQRHNVAGAIGTFCLLPGVWDRLDVPDLTVMSAPSAAMVVVGTQDIMFPPEARGAAERRIRDGYDWAGHPDRCRYWTPDKPHCYDADVQREALAWFDQQLR